MNEYFGKLLIASPKLDQTVFGRSVVYVIQDNEDATVGVILNRPADENVKQAWQGMVGEDVKNGMISIGGPIPGPVVALHQNQSAAEISLPNGIYTSASEGNLQFLAHQQDAPFHVFFGLSGWQAGQLAEEVNNGNWLSVPQMDDLLFRNSTDLWSEALQRYENRFLYEVLGIRSFPVNVCDN